jgi:MFS family permease
VLASWRVLRGDFALVWFSGLLTMTGGWMIRIALPVYIYEATGSALATGALLISGTVPSIVLGSVAGVFVDRWDLKRTMVVTTALTAIIFVPLLFVRTADVLWAFYTVRFLESSIGQFYGPSETALLPQLVREEQLTSANALNALNNNLGRLVGPALGGVVYAVSGVTGAILAYIASLVASVLLLGMVKARARERLPLPAGAAASAWRRFWTEWLAGLAVIARSPALRVIFALIGITAVGEGIFSVLFVIFVQLVLRGGAPELGLMYSAQAVGGLIGGVVVVALAHALKPRVMLGLGAVLFGLIDLAIFNYPVLTPSLIPAVVLFVLVGLPASAMEPSFTTIVQRATDEQLRGRVFSALFTTLAVAALVGMLIGSTLGDRVGVVTLLNIQGFGYVFGGLLVLRLLPR